MPDVVHMLIPVFGGALVGLAVLWGVLSFAPRAAFGAANPLARIDSDVLSEPRQFLFRNGYLVEHSENVGFLLPPPIDHLRAWDALIDALSDLVDEAGPAFRALREKGRAVRLEGTFGRDRIVVLGRRDGADIRITVSAADRSHAAIRVDLDSLRAMEDEMALLTRAGDSAPALSWAIDAEGRIIWANAAYTTLVARCNGRDAASAWPLPTLFPDEPGAPSGTVRRKVVARDGTEAWFDVTTAAPEPDGIRHVHALSLDAVIRAEDTLRSFIQTLTKSFAVLPTGLAIFDREGQLALFNPALIDMTGLDAAFLSRRPRMTDFFDALRDLQKLPEPRDYKAWRDGLAGLARGEAGRAHSETWTLPSGGTLRVTGRPQADGSVTLMLEDVSAERVATQRAQRDQAALTGLLDAVDEALVVFDGEGRRVLANAAARAGIPDLAPCAPPAAEIDLPETLEACIALWSKGCAPSPVWGEIRDLLRLPARERSGWSDKLRRPEGCDLEIRVTPLAGDRLALGFAEDRALTPPPPATARRPRVSA
ncbi:PAS-domain containing protein [Jannaschia ovalis]|uniref:PAS-domain containing protein n=1 Tax=Jannaschia ovalis TaxID=3038773 RepID=A0ABY8L8P1_9RHOB|nr:PAS-domain containing protein [Jannaschia sp. GRR-S6-38]WGH77461.1 PAS-domain containing protein [Jannaschia sp. GRR-S6-38]